MKISMKLAVLRFLIIFAAGGLSVACGKKNVKPADQPAAQAQTGVEAGYQEGDLRESEGSLRDKGYAADPELLTVNFDFDKSELSEEARGVLRENAAALKRRPAAEVQVGGHCDERGTTGYNLALGQRRANAVRDYYKYLGVKPGRMSTLSYGEERPECAESSGECWARNRRAETLIRVK